MVVCLWGGFLCLVFVACFLVPLTFLSLPLSNNDKLQHSLMTATIVMMRAAWFKKKRHGLPAA